MSEWREVYLNEAYNICSGLSKPAKDFGSGFPFLSFKEVFNNFFVPPILSELVESTDKERLNFSIQRGDVFLTRTSETIKELGMSCVALKDYENATFNGFTKRLRPKGNFAIVPEYAGYYFRTSRFRGEITAMSSASTRASLNNEMIGRLKIILPSEEEQKRIAAVLSCLDAKIDNLRRQNETLEKIAQTLFKHWFIDFEFPNDEGKPYKSSGGAMSPSELGDIPAGWKVGKLGDVAKNIRLNIKENDILSNTPYIGLEHIPRKSIVLDTWSNSEDLSSNKFIFQKGQILFGKLRPYFHKVGVAFISGICSTDILVIDAIKQEYFGCLLMLISNDNFIKYVSSASEGTRMPRTNWEYMKNYLFPLSNQLKIYKDFTNFINSFLVKIDNNTKQIQTLTKTRDALLPKLMSGEIRIKE
ncbi:MAG: restriction endonuclease subunit S [Sphaerospermopsis kisseleviana]